MMAVQSHVCLTQTLEFITATLASIFARAYFPWDWMQKDLYRTATLKPKGSSFCEYESLAGCAGPHNVMHSHFIPPQTLWDLYADHTLDCLYLQRLHEHMSGSYSFTLSMLMAKPCMRYPLLITTSLLIVGIIHKAQLHSLCRLHSLHYVESDFFPPKPPRVPFLLILIGLSEFKNHGLFTSSVAIWDACLRVRVIITVFALGHWKKSLRTWWETSPSLQSSFFSQTLILSWHIAWLLIPSLFWGTRTFRGYRPGQQSPVQDRKVRETLGVKRKGAMLLKILFKRDQIPRSKSTVVSMCHLNREVTCLSSFLIQLYRASTPSPQVSDECGLTFRHAKII